ncbi:MAG: hypothetical protein JWR30_3800 [Conexibacter sp.]|nr:hypothetical protein [Conexibacter sp.]
MDGGDYPGAGKPDSLARAHPSGVSGCGRPRWSAAAGGAVQRGARVKIRTLGSLAIGPASTKPSPRYVRIAGSFPS